MDYERLTAPCGLPCFECFLLTALFKTPTCLGNGHCEPDSFEGDRNGAEFPQT
jgi:hypothetical protein